MATEHGRFEELAVGHVLGGLPERDAADFRSHLIGCRDCRLRVAELRDIASELDATEREARRVARLTTQVADTEDEPEHEASSRVAGRGAGVAVLVLLAVAVGLAFWNLHLRETSAALVADTEIRGETLAELADGVSVPIEARDGITGLVVLDESHIAYTFTGLPHLDDPERLVVWVVTDRIADDQRRIHAPGSHPAGRLAAHVAVVGARHLIVSIEAQPVGDEPAGPVLVEADLRARADGPA